MIANIVYEKFGSVRKVNRAEVRVFCPFHNDKGNPNLDINTDSGLYFCRACGARGKIFVNDGSVAHAASRDSRWQRADLSDWPFIFASNFEVQKTAQPKISIDRHFDLVISYHYTDANGELLFKVNRYEDGNGHKNFKQIAADGTASVGNIPNVPLYWKKIAENPDKDIYLVEGEKCAKGLNDIGYLATTYAGGSNFAGTKREIIITPFYGRTVIAIPDNDKPGRKWLESIVSLISKCVKRYYVMVPNYLGLPNVHDDVYDWFENGGTTKTFDSLVQLLKLSGDGNEKV